MSSPLERVAYQLVTDEHPAREDIVGMDSDRCIALHNAILEHGWITSGRTAEDFTANTRTWWDAHGDNIDVDRLHPSVCAFLKGAREVVPRYEPETSFFYSVLGLYGPAAFWQASGWFENQSQLLSLYASQLALTSTPQGLLYDQVNHKATFHADVEDELDLELNTWVKLESILTVWIEMILREKIVALPAEVGSEKCFRNEDGSLRLVKGPEVDSATGAKRLHPETSPWTAQPWTKRDMEDSLVVWDRVVDLIEQKMDENASGGHAVGVYDQATLDAAEIPQGFCREFLLRARRPGFRNIAPGLRISEHNEFTDQPFSKLRSTARSSYRAPILLFRGDAKVSTTDLCFDYPYSGPYATIPDCICGLWLDAMEQAHYIPFEDGFRLVLPFTFHAGWARQSDMTAADHPGELLQHGLCNPYNQYHPTRLQAFLELVLANVQTGRWKVDENGVAGDINVWREADAEEGWSAYVVPIGPGAYW